jgi:predicted transcriptional regulator
MSENHNNINENNNATNVNVSITIRDIKVQFSGSVESVMISVINFLSKQVPTLDLAKKISLNYAVTDLINTYSNIIKITPEGPRVIPELNEHGKKKLSDKEMVALQLMASKIAKDLAKANNDGMTISEIQSAVALNPKSISSRLSELVKAGYVSRNNTKDEIESVIYRITTHGIYWLNSIITKKAKL